jgi:hypothetical protein
LVLEMMASPVWEMETTVAAARTTGAVRTTAAERTTGRSGGADGGLRSGADDRSGSTDNGGGANDEARGLPVAEKTTGRRSRTTTATGDRFAERQRQSRTVTFVGSQGRRRQSRAAAAEGTVFSAEGGGVDLTAVPDGESVRERGMRTGKLQRARANARGEGGREEKKTSTKFFFSTSFFLEVYKKILFF